MKRKIQPLADVIPLGMISRIKNQDRYDIGLFGEKNELLIQCEVKRHEGNINANKLAEILARFEKSNAKLNILIPHSDLSNFRERSCNALKNFHICKIWFNEDTLQSSMIIDGKPNAKLLLFMHCPELPKSIVT